MQLRHCGTWFARLSCMRSKGSPAELEHRRFLAVQRVLEGYTVGEVADFLGIDSSSVYRWVAAFSRQGAAALTARPATGRPRKLSTTQEKIVRRWLADNPMDYGFATELWTGRRVQALIQRCYGVSYHVCHVDRLLHQLGFSPSEARGPSRRAR
jgi:transposase